MGAIAANLVALLVTAVANTAANRRLTFGVRGREGAGRHQLQGLIVFGLGLALTTRRAGAARARRRPTRARPSSWPCSSLANAAATVLRFVALPRLGLPPAHRVASSAPSPRRSRHDRHPDAPTDPPATSRPRPPPLRPRSELPALAVLLVGTAALYLWNLGASGWANRYYAAAVQAGDAELEAFFFGSLDAGNVITVDKPPASLWVMALSGADLRLLVVEHARRRRR